MGAGDLSLTVFIDHGSHAVHPTTDRLQLGWLTRGIDPGVGGSDHLKICKRGQSIFWPPKMSHSFIQNCCITASFTSRIKSWKLSLHWSCLCWQCYHRYVWSAPSRQCPPNNPFADILGLSYRGPRQNSKTWVQVTRHRKSSQMVYHSKSWVDSKQSSNGYCRPDVLCRIGLACSVMNSLQRVWNCSSLSISTKVHLYTKHW